MGRHQSRRERFLRHQHGDRAWEKRKTLRRDLRAKLGDAGWDGHISAMVLAAMNSRKAHHAFMREWERKNKAIRVSGYRRVGGKWINSIVPSSSEGRR